MEQSTQPARVSCFRQQKGIPREMQRVREKKEDMRTRRRMGWEWREGWRRETWGLDATLRKRRRRRCQYNASGNEPIVSLY